MPATGRSRSSTASIWSFPAGAVVVLLGPGNGGGKSTTLRVCCGLHPITSGELRLGGTVVNGISADRLARLGVCTVPEGRGIFPNLTVHENLWLATGTGSSLSDLQNATYERFPILGQRRTQLAGTTLRAASSRWWRCPVRWGPIRSC